MLNLVIPECQYMIVFSLLDIKADELWVQLRQTPSHISSILIADSRSRIGQDHVTGWVHSERLLFSVAI